MLAVLTQILIGNSEFSTSHVSNLTPLVWQELRMIIQLVWHGFCIVFIQQLDSKLNKSRSTCPIDLKFSGKMHFHKMTFV